MVHAMNMLECSKQTKEEHQIMVLMLVISGLAMVHLEMKQI